MEKEKAVLKGLKKPTYLLEEKLLRHNLEVISDIAKRADVEIILAFKAFALWKTFPLFRQYIRATTASSLYEARLAKEEFGSPAHTYSPAYTDDTIDEIARCSSHLTFNSLTQYYIYRDRARHANPHVSLGLRINPEYSEVETLLYNPCAPGTRFGISAERLPERLPEGIDGFHCHCHCESGADVLQRTLVHVEEKFAKWFPQISWLNLGGGHLMTHKEYDRELLVELMQGLHKRYPHLRIILEPGSAFAWQTGVLVAHVVDIVEDHSIKTAILDVSFTCHMPDCLEMPYKPTVLNATTIDRQTGQEDSQRNGYIYRLGGNSCLSGDFIDGWQFDHPLEIGETIVFDDMIHYTTVKTNMFNGIDHPQIAMLHEDGTVEVLREYTYEDYKKRMD